MHLPTYVIHQQRTVDTRKKMYCKFEMLVPARSTDYLTFSIVHSFDSKAGWSLIHFC